MSIGGNLGYLIYSKVTGLRIVTQKCQVAECHHAALPICSHVRAMWRAERSHGPWTTSQAKARCRRTALHGRSVGMSCARRLSHSREAMIATATERSTRAVLLVTCCGPTPTTPFRSLHNSSPHHLRTYPPHLRRGDGLGPMGHEEL